MHSGSARILVVDDDPEVLHSMQQAFELFSHTVRIALSAPVALRLLQEQDADVVITDLLMEDYDGLDFIRALRQSWQRVLIIAVSG